jgi:hypothetical protein
VARGQSLEPIMTTTLHSRVQERLRGHYRLALLKAFGDVKIAWLTERDSLALRRIETILIEYFNPPLNKIPSYLKAEDTEKLVEYLTLSDRAPKINVIPINKFLTAQLSQIIELESLLPLPLEHKCQLTEILVEQAKTISELSRNQA